MKILLSRQIPFYSVIISGLIGAVIAIIMFSFLGEYLLPEHKTASLPIPDTNNSACEYSIARLDGYHYVKPMMSAHQTCESGKFAPIKASLENMISNYKSTGIISAASIYLRDFNQGDGFYINPDEKYDPGSLMKVPLMITYLRMAEDKPGLLDRKMTFTSQFSSIRTAAFKSQNIQLGHTYTIRQLIHAMIAYSDNDAASMLCQNLDANEFKKTFSDLGLPEIDVTANNYPITAKEFSVIMEALYNAGYLTIHDSEYATSLLAECDFKDGIVSGLPPSVMVAHKFGEGGPKLNPELHESAIVYYKNAPYLLTIMTQGKDIKQLPTVLSSMSKLVYDKMEQSL